MKYSDKDLPVLNQEVSDLFFKLKVNQAETYHDKINVIAAIQEQLKSNAELVVDENEYQDVFEAVVLSKWQIRPSLFYVNTGQPIGKGEFLQRNSLGEWNTVDFKDATLFTQSEIDSVVPEAYRQPVFILKERDALKQWGKNGDEQALANLDQDEVRANKEEIVAELNSVEHREAVVEQVKRVTKPDYTAEALRIVTAAMETE